MCAVETQPEVEELFQKSHYKEGFYTELTSDTLSKGINERVVRAISAKRNEPGWMLEFRLNAFRQWEQMKEPHWLKANYPSLDYQDYSYYSAPSCASCDSDCSEDGSNEYLTQEVETAFEQLGVPVREGSEIAVDAIFDSVSVTTTYKNELKELGIIFCSFSEAIQEHPELVKKYLGTVVPAEDNFFAALNAAVASDGTFVYIPKGFDAHASFQPTLESTKRKQDSLNEPFSSPTTTLTLAILRDARHQCETVTNCTQPSLK